MRKSLYQTTILPAIIAEIIEKNKNLLQSTGSYLAPRIDLIIDLLHEVENSGEELFNVIHPIAFSKGDYLLREGAPCKHISILETGIARQFINKNGSEPIASFFVPGEFIASYKRLGINTPSKVNIQFVTNATGYSISWANIEKLNPVYPMLTEIEKRSFEFRAYWLSDRFYQLAFSTARERYLNLRCWPKELLQQISITHIAYYLGVSLETLSRLKEEAEALSFIDYTKSAKSTYFKINVNKSKDNQADLFNKQLITFTKAINQVSNIIKKVRRPQP